MALDISSSGFGNLTGKSVVITGGSSGIGLEASKLFSSHGAFVTIADLSPPSELVLNSTFAHCGATSWESILAAYEIAVQKHRTVVVFIANAGVGEVEDFFLDMLDDAGKLKQPKHTVLDINLKGVLDCLKVAIHYMRQQERGGAIVMTTSTAGYVGEKGLPAYSAAKLGGIDASIATTSAQYNFARPQKRTAYPSIRPRALQAMAYLVSTSFNGKTIFCAADKFKELEDSLADKAHQ